MTCFRPCIDLHNGRVKQIVGSTLSEDGAGLETNFETDKPADSFAALYRRDGLTGGHVIQLGPGNREAAMAALQAYPGGLQVGGGMTPDNAGAYLDAGASHVIVTSFLFPAARFSADRLAQMVAAVGAARLVIDLSCRRVDDRWVVAMDRWQTPTDMAVDATTLDQMAESCSEFLVHAADVEGMCRGVAEELVSLLGAWGKKPVTYAGGAHALSDLQRVQELSDGKVDLTIGSALDIFGGTTVRYADCVAFNNRRGR